MIWSAKFIFLAWWHIKVAGMPKHSKGANNNKSCRVYSYMRVFTKSQCLNQMDMRVYQSLMQAEMWFSVRLLLYDNLWKIHPIGKVTSGLRKRELIIASQNKEFSIVVHHNISEACVFRIFRHQKNEIVCRLNFFCTSLKRRKHKLFWGTNHCYQG